eukprot:scaffold85743_cov52-Phaeocystis_antarctica.AAC.1
MKPAGVVELALFQGPVAAAAVAVTNASTTSIARATSAAVAATSLASTFLASTALAAAESAAARRSPTPYDHATRPPPQPLPPLPTWAEAGAAAAEAEVAGAAALAAVAAVAASARARHTFAGARHAGAEAHHTAAEARHADARARHAVARARHAVARARHAVVQETGRALHPSCARPSPQGAAGAGKPVSRSVSRPGAHPAAAVSRCGRGRCRCRSVDPRPCRRRRGDRRAGHGLASDPWHPVVCRRDLRSGSHGRRRVAHGRLGGRGRGYGCG